MKPWTEDALEQIAVAQILNHAGLSSGERLGLIICDNAVEFMAIAYAEMEKHLVGRSISKKDWDSTKHAFEKLLDFTVVQESRLGEFRDDIVSFHKVRNTLYHTGQPVSVKRSHVEKYIEIAKQAAEILLQARSTKEEWERHVAAVYAILAGQAAGAVKEAITAEAVDDGVRIKGAGSLGNLETICLVLDVYAKQFGKAPNPDQLERSLVLSGATHLTGPNLAKRLYDCRQKGLIQKDLLSLKSRGRQLVEKKVLLRPV